MKIVDACAIAVMLLAGETTSIAQQTSILLEKSSLETSVAKQISFSVDSTFTDSYSSSLSPVGAPSEPLDEGIVSRVAPVKEHRTLDKNYYLFNGLHLALGLLDVGLTQRCIAAHQCAEGNPLMPSSLAGQLSVNVSYFGYAAFFSYNLKKHHSRLWWISPTSGMATHTIGVATGMMHYGTLARAN